jgi:mannose-1-phosphate guanylyltransferase
MKAFLLAAGRGTRLKPYTDQHPKCLIPIHGEPLLGIWIDLLVSHGVSEILINTHHHADQVERFLTRIRPLTPARLHTVNEPNLRGSAGTLWDNRDFVSDQSDFIIAYADNLTNLNWTKVFDIHAHFRSMGGVLTMGLIKAPNPRACGIVTLDATHKIVKFLEKPESPESDLANGGVYMAGRGIFEFMGHDGGGQVRDIGHHLLPCLIGKMYGFSVAPDYLKDIGTPQAYKEALNEWPPRRSRKS